MDDRQGELWPWCRPVDTTLCADCGVDTLALCEWYMVRDELWASAWPGGQIERSHPGSQVLCIGCLEQRLGRQLTATDFTDAPVNRMANNSPRLRDRIIDDEA